MDKTKRKTIEGWIDKASNQFGIAREKLMPYQYSESVQASQVCIELSVKSLLSLLGIRYPPSHKWEQDKKEFVTIAKQIRERRLLDKLAQHNLDYTIRLPRLLFLANFWGQFYITAKYGFEAEYLASAKDLFDEGEASLAMRHADECLRAASVLRYLSEDKLAAIVSRCDDAAPPPSSEEGD
jgi:HEPN domain-containing protein